MTAPNAMVPLARSSTRATSAHPPLGYRPETMAQWKARHKPKPSIWARLFGRKGELA